MRGQMGQENWPATEEFSDCLEGVGGTSVSLRFGLPRLRFTGVSSAVGTTSFTMVTSGGNLTDSSLGNISSTST